MRSLEDAGFNVDTPGVDLVETGRPRRAHPTSVLAQSAWNVLPHAEFVQALRPYPRKMQAKAMARREVARLNLRRARKVVCLTTAMAEMTERFAGRNVTVASVCLPMDARDAPDRRRHDEAEPVAVVPGTITWYKRPQAALEWVAAHPDLNIRRLRLLGEDDGSGCLGDVVGRAGRLDLDVRAAPTDRKGLWSAMAGARVVLLPSEMESLGFALGEALWVARSVVANRIPAHAEVADQLHAQPQWMGEPAAGHRLQRALGDGEIYAQWRHLGSSLGLEPL